VIASFKKDHVKALTQQDRRKSSVVLMSARRDADGQVIGEEDKRSSSIQNNTNESSGVPEKWVF